MMKRTVIEAGWTVIEKGERLSAEPGLSIVVEGDRIAGITRDSVAEAGERISRPGMIAVPGFINLHNHCINGPLFRGLIDDVDATAWGQSKIYSILLPVADMAMALSDEDLEAVVALGLIEVASSGATTLVEMFRPRQAMTFDLAEKIGLRFYGAPYLFSPRPAAPGREAEPQWTPQMLIRDTLKFHSRYDGAANGRLRFVWGPHAVDTCDAALLGAVRDAADETGSLVTLHAAQSRGERQIMTERHGTTAIDHLAGAGLLREGTILAHGCFFDDEELARIADSGAAIASCPTVFARGGAFAPYWRFKRRGVRTGIGTDAYRMDFITEMRNAGLISKLEEQQGHVASAEDILRTVTLDAAAILRRSDIGVLKAGAQADIVLVDLSVPRLQPVFDPIRTLVWYTSAQDIDLVMIAGESVIRDGQYMRGDAVAVAKRAARPVKAIWQRARELGVIH